MVYIVSVVVGNSGLPRQFLSSPALQKAIFSLPLLFTCSCNPDNVIQGYIEKDGHMRWS
jgi:hypothetical protein